MFSRFIELNNKVFAIYGVFLPFLVMSCEINNRKYVSPVDSDLHSTLIHIYNATIRNSHLPIDSGLSRSSCYLTLISVRVMVANIAGSLRFCHSQVIPILLRLFRYKYIEPKAMLCLHLYHQFRILESMIHCLGRWTNKVRVRLEVSQ